MKFLRLLALQLALLAVASVSFAQQNVLRVGHFPNITHAQERVALDSSREGRSVRGLARLAGIPKQSSGQI